ncbi:hypothetical protein [Natronorarus salvus]|uniref:hypothetical protein n=1 Tax=Natronorarus salvus TaxID=3117733 RepID=UPI002F26814B
MRYHERDNKADDSGDGDRDEPERTNARVVPTGSTGGPRTPEDWIPSDGDTQYWFMGHLVVRESATGFVASDTVAEVRR